MQFPGMQLPGMEPAAKRIRLGDVEEASPDSQEYQELMFKFLGNPTLQSHAVDQFMALKPQQQLAIMQRGTLDTARDPTAMLITRISHARKAPIIPIPAGSLLGPGEAPRPAVGPEPESADFDMDVAFFLNYRQVPLHAIHEFMGLSQQQQSQVMSMGPLNAALGDPTTDLVSRLGKFSSRRPDQNLLRGGAGAEGGGGIGGGMGRGMGAGGVVAAGGGGASPEAVQAFLSHNQIQPHAQERFLTMSPEEQMNIMAMGPLTDARNPTAVLITRMNKGQGGRGIQTPSPGDWFCPTCGDLNFATRPECRSCGTPNPNPVTPRPAPPQHAVKTRLCTHFMKGNCTRGSACTFAHGENELPQIDAETVSVGASAMQQLFGITEEEVERFLGGCEAHAIQRFLTLSAGEQMLLMKKGSLVDARNPTAVLVTRMNALAKTKKSVY